MEELKSIVADFVSEKLGQGTAWYTWEFKVDEVPSAVLDTPLTGCWYSKNVILKKSLNKAWLSEESRRAELEKYYIAVWGGVRANRPEKLRLYGTNSAEQNIARGSNGIASWSKALCVRDPLNYAIFDARVSASLNALQIIHARRVPLKSQFPKLASRNKAVVAGQSMLAAHIAANKWPAVKNTFYTDYLRLCRAVGTQLGQAGSPRPIYDVEMVLFAHTEELLQTAFSQQV